MVVFVAGDWIVKFSLYVTTGPDAAVKAGPPIPGKLTTVWGPIVTDPVAVNVPG
jgi:hypothetical protein